jgi:catalase
VHSLVWEEAQIINGMDPDFHRRDLADAIEAGAYPEWELGIQAFPDTEDQMFEGIDLLDPTKFVPEELAPVQPVGLMTLNANPTNFFAETEQVAFHPGHLVPGIDVTNDPLLQVRLFSYLDTQISRLGGPNFAQIPINRPHAPVNDMLRDGMHQTAVHAGVAPYRPNSLDGGCPFLAGQDMGAFVDVPEAVAESVKERRNPASFDDHYSQARLFFRSLGAVEQDHVIQAYTFELGKCFETPIRERQLQALANIDAGLCAAVAAGLGMPAPEATEQVPDRDLSPALSQLGATWPVAGRVVGIITDSSSDLAQVAAARTALDGEGMVPLVIAPTGGTLSGDGLSLTVQRTFLTARSTEFDALIVAGGQVPAPDATAGRDAKAGNPAGSPDPRVALMLSEAYRHAKAIGAWGSGSDVLAAAGIPAEAPGISAGDAGAPVAAGISSLLAAHRAWDRFPATGQPSQGN